MFLRLLCLVAFSLASSTNLSVAEDQSKMVQKVYAVNDLIPPGLTNRDVSSVAEILTNRIISTIRPQSWSPFGGKGTIDFYSIGGAFVVNQSPEIQKQVAGLIEELRKQNEGKNTAQ